MTRHNTDDELSHAAPSCRKVGDSSGLAERYRGVRGFSEGLAEPLSPEDCCIQSMPDVSPTKWHLAHTTWFFETFLLEGSPGYKPFDPQFRVLFNSYYNGVGEQFPRPRRGLLSRPSLADVLYYRQYVDEALLARLDAEKLDTTSRHILEVGLQHEQQHQELILTDIKHVLSQNPLLPVYRECDGSENPSETSRRVVGSGWQNFDEGLFTIGHGGQGFAYDNESPQHRTFLESFSLSERTVTCGEWIEFIEAGGYDDPSIWLSLGWSSVEDQQWCAPLYWFRRDDQWWQFTLAGPQPVDPELPVCHISYFEADAFARWTGRRLPTEAEWEVAAGDLARSGHFVDTVLANDRALHPHPEQVAADESDVAPTLQSMYGNVWEWTSSPYSAYPGYQPPEGALGEYNGKFMTQQYVLRGGSVATHSSHIRPTYRNFFPPEARWQFSGLRLAR